MIRVATKADLPIMLKLAGDHLKNCNYDRLVYNSDKARLLGQQLLDNDGFFVVIEHDGKVVGGMLGDVVSPWFSDSKVGIEYIIYVDPGHRQGRDTYRLIRSWLEWCKIQQCVQIRPMVTSGNMQVCRLYKAMGFELAGETFLMNT